MSKTTDLSKKTGNIKGIVHARMGTIKDRNGKDLRESEEIKKRCQEYTELHKTGLNDPENRDSVITHLEPDMLECEVKWALGSITMNKDSGGKSIPGKLFQILKKDVVKVLYSICQQIWKLSSGQRTRKGQLSFQFQRKAMPKNVQATGLLCSFHMLVSLRSKSFRLGFSSM